jgi:hypothetical protein
MFGYDSFESSLLCQLKKIFSTFLNVTANLDTGNRSNDLFQPFAPSHNGLAGQLYGSYWTDRFADGWQSNLDTPGAVQFGYLGSFFTPLAWWNLVPDQGHLFVVSGNGVLLTPTYRSVAPRERCSGDESSAQSSSRSKTFEALLQYLALSVSEAIQFVTVEMGFRPGLALVVSPQTKTSP